MESPQYFSYETVRQITLADSRPELTDAKLRKRTLHVTKTRTKITCESLPQKEQRTIMSIIHSQAKNTQGDSLVKEPTIDFR